MMMMVFGMIKLFVQQKGGTEQDKSRTDEMIEEQI